MPGSLVFTAATDADADRVVDLVQSAYRGDASRQGWTTEADLLDDERIDAAGVRGKVATPGSTVLLVTRDDDGLVACCELVDRGDGTSYFGLFAVRPGLQAAGLGRQVLAEAEQRASREHGSTTMEMTVLAPRTDLVAWYERRGYTRTGETREFVFADEHPELEFVVLRKSLWPQVSPPRR
ncbi:MAG: GCN5-related N-acetyltransferase [Nocardioidaceae bacterium]|nr:GCN5-related N-acetyltransferase [Nocardioidaceae bacterium]